MDEQKNGLVRCGDFLFKYRNYIFPIVMVTMFLSFAPPEEYFGKQWIEQVKDVVAVGIILCGLAIRSTTIGWAYIKRGGLNKRVYAENLVTEGMFGVCRNPLYVGNLLLFIGIFIMHGDPVVMIAGIALYVFIYIAIVAAEEFYLKKEFGAGYAEYCKNVNRWIPDFSKYKDSTQGLHYSIRRAIFKDYTTIFNILLAAILVELIEDNPYHSFANFLSESGFALTSLVILCLAFGTVVYMKKSGAFKKQ